MADEEASDKTEEATGKRLSDARSKGQVAQSTELVGGLMLAASIGSLLVLGGGLTSSAGSLLSGSFGRMAEFALEELTAADFAAVMSQSVTGMATSLAILVVPVLMVGFVAGYGQVGFMITPKAVAIDPSKLSPASGAKKIFGPRGAVRTGMGVMKIALIGTTIVTVALSQLPMISAVTGTDATQVVRAIGHVFLIAASSGVVVIVALALIDFSYQRFQHSKDMRMTKKEVRDEAKDSEGDPQVKAHIRQVQREMASRRMMDDVPDATVVITNPTHYAVALRYKDGLDAAPTVVAKGLDQVALKIREIATDSKVMIVEEPPLARALHRSCDIGDSVPEDLFEAVAKILAYVYRMEGKAASA